MQIFWWLKRGIRYDNKLSHASQQHCSFIRSCSCSCICISGCSCICIFAMLYLLAVCNSEIHQTTRSFLCSMNECCRRRHDVYLCVLVCVCVCVPACLLAFHVLLLGTPAVSVLHYFRHCASANFMHFRVVQLFRLKLFGIFENFAIWTPPWCFNCCISHQLCHSSAFVCVSVSATTVQFVSCFLRMFLPCSFFFYFYFELSMFIMAIFKI